MDAWSIAQICVVVWFMGWLGAMAALQDPKIPKWVWVLMAAMWPYAVIPVAVFRLLHSRELSAKRNSEFELT